MAQMWMGDPSGKELTRMFTFLNMVIPLTAAMRAIS